MGLFRKKKETTTQIDISRPLELIVDDVIPLRGDAIPIAASVATDLLTKHAQVWGADTRPYVLRSESMDSAGLSLDWRLSVLYPTMRAEGLWQLRSVSDRVAEVAFSITPVPAPGSPEYMLAQVSPQMVAYHEESWQIRLSVIAALPTAFVDSPAIAKRIEAENPGFFRFGPIHIQARRLPTGVPVWETKSMETIQLPFAISEEIHVPTNPMYTLRNNRF